MRLRLALAAALVSSALIVGCSGGGGTTTSTASPAAPTATPAVNPMQLYLATASETAGTSPIVQPSPGSIGATTLSLSYTTTGSTQGILAFEPGFVGEFYTQTKCSLSPDAVTVSPTNSVGSNIGLFVITTVAAGNCAISITDGIGNYASVQVDVTTTTGTISATKRN
ncbi:MAG TPA: hypothetical protein VMD91_14305 [Candidatus Sulfotelmatobacter sp.]|nr:hypothetical protein [Candidatus Sulfotelmatobacter sp.]